jgi:hypothetical protein
MKGQKTYFYRQSISQLLKTRWVAPYLLIPPLLAFMVYAEAYLASQGVAGIGTLSARTVLALWNGAFLLALLAGINACLFFSSTWGSGWFRNSLALPVSRPSGYWGPYLALLSVATGVFVLTTGAVIAAIPDSARISLLNVTAEAFLPLLWAVSMGAFLGILTTGTSGALFLSALTILGFISGMTGRGPDGILQYIIPPLGKMMTLGPRYPEGLEQALILLVHCTVFLVLGRILYGAGIRRR